MRQRKQKKYGDLEICDGQQEYSQLELRMMWEQFSDIPIGFTDDNIQEEFLGFPVGTDRFDIWHWFDERYAGGVHTLMEDADA